MKTVEWSWYCLSCQPVKTAMWSSTDHGKTNTVEARKIKFYTNNIAAHKIFPRQHPNLLHLTLQLQVWVQIPSIMQTAIIYTKFHVQPWRKLIHALSTLPGYNRMRLAVVHSTIVQRADTIKSVFESQHPKMMKCTVQYLICIPWHTELHQICNRSANTKLQSLGSNFDWPLIQIVMTVKDAEIQFCLHLWQWKMLLEGYNDSLRKDSTGNSLNIPLGVQGLGNATPGDKPGQKSPSIWAGKDQTSIESGRQG